MLIPGTRAARAAVATLGLSAALAVISQPAEAQSEQGPKAEAGAAVAEILPPSTSPSAYKSAFAGYRRFSDEPLMPWRSANDTVRAIGGWQAYAREAQQAIEQEDSSTDGHDAHDQHRQQ